MCFNLVGAMCLFKNFVQRFGLAASGINITVAWSRDEVLVGSVLSSEFWVYCLITSQFHCFFLVHHSKWDVYASSNTCFWRGDGTQTVRRRVWGSDLFHLSLRANVEKRPVHLSGYRRHWLMPLSKLTIVWEDYQCCWQWGVTYCYLWRLAHFNWVLRGIP